MSLASDCLLPKPAPQGPRNGVIIIILFDNTYILCNICPLASDCLLPKPVPQEPRNGVIITIPSDNTHIPFILIPFRVFILFCVSAVQEIRKPSDKR